MNNIYIPENSQVFLEGNSYLVFIDVIINETLASYCLHCEGNPRIILRLFLKNKHKLHKNKYYMLKQEKFFRNHSEIIYDENGDKLYKYTGE